MLCILVEPGTAALELVEWIYKSIYKIQKSLFVKFYLENPLCLESEIRPIKCLKPQLHIHGFGPGRATVHPDLSNRGASA